MTDSLENSVFMRALRQQPVTRRPLWLMRQAGRYLPEYRQLRQSSGGFLKMVKTPAIACEITQQPIRRFAFDAAIIFSDILIIPDAMGLGLHFVEGEGPRFSNPLQDDASIRRLSLPPEEALTYLFDACTLTRQTLPADVPLIGFCGAPFTLACYMIDGCGGHFWQTRQLRHARPDLLHRVLAVVTDAVAQTLIGQINAGCQAVMLFDSWGGLLSDDSYDTFSLQYIRRITDKIAASSGAPVIVFARQCAHSLSRIADCQVAAVGVDWQTALVTARNQVNDKVALQGNMDPAVLLTDPDTVMAQTTATLSSYGHGHGHIFNLGHGVDKRTPLENVSALVEAVHAYVPPS